MAGNPFTTLLQELQNVLPAALECCGDSQQSQSDPLVAKLRSVLFELLHSINSKPGMYLSSCEICIVISAAKYLLLTP